jgi:hypothetical protein
MPNYANQTIEGAHTALDLWKSAPDSGAHSPKQAVYIACEKTGADYDDVLNFLLIRGMHLEKSQEWLSDVSELLRGMNRDPEPGAVSPNAEARLTVMAKETWAVDALASHEPDRLLRDNYTAKNGIMSKLVRSHA